MGLSTQSSTVILSFLAMHSAGLPRKIIHNAGQSELSFNGFSAEAVIL